MGHNAPSPALELKNITKSFTFKRTGMFFPKYLEHLAVNNISIAIPKTKLSGW